MAFVKLLESQDVGEVAVLKSVLDANRVPHFIQNEHFGSLYPGIPLPPNSGMMVMVHEAELKRAAALLREMTRPELRLLSDEEGETTEQGEDQR